MIGIEAIASKPVSLAASFNRETPATLPVQQVFELIITLTSAKALDVTVSAILLSRADK